MSFFGIAAAAPMRACITALTKDHERPDCSSIRRAWESRWCKRSRATGTAVFLERAKELAKIIVSRLANPKGGYFDRGQSELAFFGARLTLIDQNGVAASFFLRLAAASGEPAYRDAALRALGAFGGDFAAHGIDAAPYGHALSEFFA